MAGEFVPIKDKKRELTEIVQTCAKEVFMDTG